MINSIDIQNYQSIAKAHLEFSRFTSIVGTSNVGKSSVIRALNSIVILPRGGAYVREGETYTKVVVTTDDGHDIAFIRDAGKSSIELDGREFTRLGGIMPDIVTSVAKLGPITVQSDEKVALHIQDQFSPVFSLNDSARSRAGTFASLTGIGKLTDALRNINRDAKTYARDLKQKSEVVVDLEEKVNILKQHDLQKMYDVIYTLDNEVTRLLGTYESVEGAVNTYLSYRDTLKALDNIPSEIVDSDNHQMLAECLSKAEQHLSNSSAIYSIGFIEQDDKSIRQISEVCNSLESLITYVVSYISNYTVLQKIEEIVSVIVDDTVLNTIVEALTLLVSWKNIRDDMLGVDTEIDELQQQLKDMQASYHDQHIGEICELCGTLLGD